MLQTEIKYVPGVGPKKALLLQQELQLFTVEDLIFFYPFRYEDRRKLYKIKTLAPGLSFVQVRGTLCNIKVVKSGKKRLLACLRDDTGEITLVWFTRLQWILRKLQTGAIYTAFGKLVVYGQQFSLVHPELEIFLPKRLRIFRRL